MGACHRIGGDRVRMDRLPILECASERVLRRVDIFSNVAADRCQFQPVGACRHHVVGVYRGNGNQRPERALAAGAHGGFRIHGWPCCDRSRRGVLLVRSFDGAVVLGFGWNLYSVRHGALRDRVGMVRHRIVDERVQRCRRDDDDGHGVSSCGLRVFFPSRRHVPYGRSGQSAGFRAGRGAAALCFIPVVAAEPQLLLPLMLSFLVFLMLVRSHRTTLLLIPLPAASVCAPTLVNTVRFAGAGTWRQIFGSVILPSSAHDGHPMIANLSDIVSRAFGVAVSGEIWQYVAAAMLALIVLLAAVSLFLPFVLRVSRMMWVVAIAGLATSLLSAAVVVAVDADGAVAGSVLPGVSFTMMGLLSCVCMVAGGAVQRFVMLWQRPTGDVEVERNGASTGIIAGRAARIVLVMLIAASVVASAGFDYVARDHNTVSTSDSGLPIVASDYLAQDEARRVLAVRADSAGSISYNVMRTRRGDLIDSSPAQRVEVAFGRSDDANKAIAKDCAQLLSNADSDAVADLSELGFGGIYVVRSGEDKAQKEITDQLSSNISASDGTQNVVSTDAGTYYRLTIQDTAKQHIDRKGYRQAESSVWRQAWLWCMGIVLAAYCLVALPRMRRHGQEEA